ncbi:translation initiation factor IF-2-like [Eublepharis macularius]|uniref:Translation initiation factor IF-2-like n=1 Tax=Eublepharis macularius TaxID=481883 RepID=A0AA97J1N1_EUBMA|nr:translation initiation factor IF-2-like [Eublepharis macularius]
MPPPGASDLGAALQPHRDPQPPTHPAGRLAWGGERAAGRAGARQESARRRPRSWGQLKAPARQAGRAPLPASAPVRPGPGPPRGLGASGSGGAAAAGRVASTPGRPSPVGGGGPARPRSLLGRRRLSSRPEAGELGGAAQAALKTPPQTAPLAAPPTAGAPRPRVALPRAVPLWRSPQHGRRATLGHGQGSGPVLRPRCGKSAGLARSLARGGARQSSARAVSGAPPPPAPHPGGLRPLPQPPSCPRPAGSAQQPRLFPGWPPVRERSQRPTPGGRAAGQESPPARPPARLPDGPGALAPRRRRRRGQGPEGPPSAPPTAGPARGTAGPPQLLPPGRLAGLAQERPRNAEPPAG